MKILAVQNRMGIGDMIIFLPYIEAISKKFKNPVSILVKQNTKSSEILKNNPYIDKIIFLDRNDHTKEGRHFGFIGTLNLTSDIQKYNFDKVFIFNSSLRFRIIMKIAKIKDIYQYKLFDKKKQNIIKAAQDFLKKSINLDVESKPEISISPKDVNEAFLKYNIAKKNINILLGIGGSGDTKRVPAEKYIEFIKLCTNNYECKFFLATGKKYEEQEILKKILNSNFKNYCKALDDLTIAETLPIIKNCNLAVCNDTSFSHLSAALEIETIVLMTDSPLLYGSYSPKMHPIIPDGEKTVTHNTLGKDKINPEKIFNKMKEILKLS
jgi:heptosyltransferase-2